MLINTSQITNPSSAPKVHNNIALPPVDFLIVVSRSMTAGIGLIFLMFCGVVALGFLGWWISRSETYELELDGQPTRIRLSRIGRNIIPAPSGEMICTIRRGLFGGCRIAAKKGLQINGKEKSKLLPSRGGNITVDGEEEHGYLSTSVSLRQLRKTRRRKPRRARRGRYSADTDLDLDSLC